MTSVVPHPSACPRRPAIPGEASNPGAAAPSFRSQATATGAEADAVFSMEQLEQLVGLFSARSNMQREELYRCVHVLTRCIEKAIQKNGKLPINSALPLVIKQVYQNKDITFLKSDIMVLMLTIKNACKKGWFSPSDTDELLAMADELCNSFCTVPISTTEQDHAVNTITKITSRFYPQLKICHLVSSFEAKLGYEVLVTDFHLQKKVASEETIRLLIAQTDNLESSSCLVSPQQVNFLVNGRGVEKRTSSCMEVGPQCPTDITKMLKYGTNIIQAFGYFNANYVIAIAYMVKLPLPDASELEGYVQHSPLSNSDCDIIEGPSKVTLICPISFKPIKIPVKGHFCKHFQCFDYGSYMDINFTRPCWRCPFCSQTVSYCNVRIDQNLFKILGEVGSDADEVVIFSNGTWKLAAEKTGEKFTPQGNDISDSKSNSFQNIPPNIINLAEDGNEKTGGQKEPLNFSADTSRMKSMEIDDKKAIIASNTVTFPQVSFVPSTVNPPTTGIFGTLESLVSGAVLNPVFPDTVDTMANMQPTQHASQMNHTLQNILVQQCMSTNTITPIERHSLPRVHIRAPGGVQSHGQQSQIPNLSQLSQLNGGRSTHGLSDASPSTSNVRLQLSSATRQYLARTQAVRGQIASLDSSRVPVDFQGVADPYRDTERSYGDLQYAMSQHYNVGAHPAVAVPASRPSGPYVVSNAHQNQGSTSGTARIPDPSFVGPGAQGVGLQTTASRIPLSRNMTSSNDLRTLSNEQLLQNISHVSAADQNWVPSGQMRGSLSGQAYSDALTYYLARPIRQQPDTMPSHHAPRVIGASTSEPVLYANNSSNLAHGILPARLL